MNVRKKYFVAISISENIFKDEAVYRAWKTDTL